MRTKIYIVLVLFLLMGCESPIESNQTLNFDRKAILTNVAENIIMPQLSNFQTKTDSLVVITIRYSDSATTQNLSKLRIAWVAAMLEWEAVTPFAFGPAYDLNTDFNVNYWATSSSLIDAEIAGTQTFSPTYFANMGVSKKGFPAMEYLIFRYNNLDSTNQTFQTDANAQRRKLYLKNLVLDIQAQSLSLSNAWKNGYKDSFIKNDGNDASSSLTALVNQMIAALEVVINKKIGSPLGKKGNGVVQLGSIQNVLSQQSLSAIKKNIEMIQTLFNGGNGTGLDDYLIALNIKSSDNISLEIKINKQFLTLITSLNYLSEPFSSQLVNNKTAVENVWTQSKLLLVSLKVDLTSSLGISITLNDTDGD